MGGAIGLRLASTVPCIGVVAMSTPHQLPPNPLLDRLRPVLKPLSTIYRFREKGISEWRDGEAERERVQYDSYPLRSLIELDLVLGEMRKSLPKIHVPTLFIHSRTDTSVPADHMESNFNMLVTQDKEKIWIKESDHIITADHARSEVFRIVGNFIDRNSEPRK
jgi:carboxylesterase